MMLAAEMEQLSIESLARAGRDQSGQSQQRRFRWPGSLLAINL